MGKKKELILFTSEIEIYCYNLAKENGEPAGNEEKRKTRSALADFMIILSKHGRIWPDEWDFEEYKSTSKCNSDETSRNEKRVRKFFAWIENERKNDIMTETAQPLNDETITETTAPIEPEENENPAPVKKKPGRKVFDTVNGEKKSEKLMLYLTPELIAKIRVWCDMKGISNVSYITALIEADLHNKEDKINTFLKMRSEL